MISDTILNALNGKGPLQADIDFAPVEHIKLRPNLIFDLLDSKNVLHLGCTDHLDVIDNKIENGVYLHQQLSFVTNECLGIDINTEAIEYVRKKYGIDNIIYADITKPYNKQITKSLWDYLLMAEVLEHIDNPVWFLQQIVKNYRKSIRNIIITVPNALGIYAVNNVTNHGRESVNIDHRYWFTPYTICNVAYKAGLVPTELHMCLYENSAIYLENNEALLKSKPLLLDTIVLVCSL